MNDKTDIGVSMSGNSNKKSWLEKYGNALKLLIPIRCSKQRDKTVLPNNNVGFFSYVSANWMNKTMWKASRKHLEPDEIKQLGKADGVNINSERLMRLWDDELRKFGTDNASLHRTVWRFNRFRLIMAAVMMAMLSVFSYLGPAWILEYMLDFLAEPDQPLWYGLLLVLALSISQLLRNVAYSALWIIGTSAGVRVAGALQVMTYEKVLRIKDGGEKLIAEVVNYSSSDIERIFQSMQLSMLAVGAPVMWLLNVVYCYLLMGPWSLLGNIIILLYYPVMILVGKMTSSFRVQAIRLTDKRIGLMNQVLSSIKLIKMYAWEETFSNGIKDVRHDEEKVLRKANFLQSLSWTSSPVISMIAPMASIIGYVLWGENLSAAQAFTIMSVYSALLLPLNTLPIAVKAFSEGIVSCGRIQKMFLSPDACQPTSQGITGDSRAICIQDATIAWDNSDNNSEKPKNKKLNAKIQKPKDATYYSSQVALCANSVANSTNSLDCIATDANMNNINGNFQAILTDINFVVEKGQLIGICGNVGSGKSTLLAAVSGSANVIKGEVGVRGSIALVTQQAWIFNGTAQENIIFGLPYDEQKYKYVVSACSLETDFKLMPNGDKTEIGERGANLSGGQKQRISLARALYSNRDIYLLDDVLSAVDVSVSKHIFENCIKNGLRGKTVLLVSHAVHVLEHCDYIYLLKDGEILERGTHQMLVNDGGEYSQMVNTDKMQRHANEVHNEIERKKSLKKSAEVIEDMSSDGSMIKSEVDKSISLSWKSWLYFCKMSGGYCISLLVFLVIFLFNAAIMFNSIWLQVWLDAGSGMKMNSTWNTSIINETIVQDMGTDVSLNPHLHMYISVFGASAIVIILFGILKGFAIGNAMLTGASALHHTMFWKIIRSPMSFFDTTPLGRIINRFSKDMDECDNYIPYCLEFVSQTYMLTFFQLILIGVLYPWYFAGLCVAFVIFLTFDFLFNPGVRSTKRLENLLRPPLLVHLSATVQGLPIIRCFEKQEIFAKKFRTYVDKHLSAYLLFQLSSKWLAFRCDTISWLVVTGTGLLVILSRGTTSPAVAGLAMVQIFRVCGVISVIMRWKSELSARLISIERISDYCKNLVEEAPAIVDDNRPISGWPSEGAISFKDVHLRYRPELPLVLQGLTVEIKGGENVGIIGRTGAGKSSVIGTLLRLTEICAGSISIDGVDISQLGLKDLRSVIAVIPQEPVLFEGTIRWNLDPYNEISDDLIWDALEKAHLKKKIIKEPHRLDTFLNAEAGLFSLGEKQLFCLARALLRNSKILLLDEATASVDVETDRLIQKSIRSAFSHCTVLTIAHRLNTISDYDKIMTMDAGKAVEFDSPASLMGKDSLFRNMMKSMMESKYS